MIPKTIYCNRCKKKTLPENVNSSRTKNKRTLYKGYCSVCGKNVCQIGAGFISNTINKIIEKSPIELHVPGYQFLGPATKYKERALNYDQGINLLDSLAKGHDAVYDSFGPGRKRYEADLKFIKGAKEIYNNKNLDFKQRMIARGIAIPAVSFMSNANKNAFQKRQAGGALSSSIANHGAVQRNLDHFQTTMDNLLFFG